MAPLDSPQADVAPTAVDSAPLNRGASTEDAPARRRVRLVGALRESSIAVALVLLVIVVTTLQPRFLSLENITQILLSVAITAILVAGQSIVIISRNVDLSVGSVVGFTAYLCAQLLKVGTPLLIAVLLAVLAGGVAGAINGFVVSTFDVPSIVVTLGTLSVFRGAVFILAGGKQVSASDVPQAYPDLTLKSVLGVPYLVIYAVVIVTVVTVLLRTTLTGRRIYAIGSSPDTADQVGIPRRRLVFLVFVIAGLLAGVGGVLWGSRFATVDANSASGIELGIIAASVIGGVGIFGGSGSILGAALGAVLLQTIQNALAVLNLDQFYLQAIQGLVILVAVVADSRVKAYLAGVLATGRRR